MADEHEEKVRRRAYGIWEEEGRPTGREREHWDQASREIGEEDGGGADGEATGAKPRRRSAARSAPGPEAPEKKKRPRKS